MSGLSTPQKRPPVPGNHITDQQVRLYMDLRRTHTREAAAAKAALSATTGARLDADPQLPSQQQTPRGRRRPDPLAAIWDSEIVPMLEAVPGLRPVSIVTEMLRRHRDFSAATRRTLERRVRTWQALHGTERDVIFRQEHPPGASAGTAGPVGLHRCQPARRHHRRRAAAASALSLSVGVLWLAACRGGARRREFRGSGRRTSERIVGARRRTARASQRQSLGGIPQSRP
jgi:hypothetical protein